MSRRTSPVLSPAVQFCRPGEPSLLETSLPYSELSQLIAADRRRPDPAYGVHRWWARRPPSAIRGLLLAAALPAEAGLDAFWSLFASSKPVLRGLRVHDLFVGGGTTVVEAARLGAEPSGTDVDPLAIRIVKHELNPPDPALIARASGELIAYVTSRAGRLFPKSPDGWTPLHYFYLHEVRCPSCAVTSLLYRSLVIARAIGKPGGVVRDAVINAFCPDCTQVHHLRRQLACTVQCCGRRHALASRTFSNTRFECPSCHVRSTHAVLRTGIASRRLIAVEETSPSAQRRIRSVLPGDVAALDRASDLLSSEGLRFPLCASLFSTDRRDSRPISLGLTSVSDLFLPRQTIVFAYATKWLTTAAYSSPVRRALALALSNAITSNNRLCGYATDYGRLAPLFTVRSYALPALPVELNSLHPTAGRGTLRRCLDRAIASASTRVVRHVWSTSSNEPVQQEVHLPRRARTVNIRCASAARPFAKHLLADICLFDPPYFDYIAYSELSEIYRGCFGTGSLGGTPLMPGRNEPTQSFATGLAACFGAALGRLKRGRPMIFTYHSSDRRAWHAIALALDRSLLRVTGLWPIRCDPHMGPHVRSSNCEWDLVVVCRRARETAPGASHLSIRSWMRGVAPLQMNEADRTSIRLAINMATGRWGILTEEAGARLLEVRR
jgi:putative DNA methylase